MILRDRPLPYADKLAPRALADVDLVVIHCTELPDLAMAREYGERIHYAAGTGNSGHLYIDRDGSVERWVPYDRVAHHCRGYNPRSIGIELVNIGRYPAWYDSRRQVMSEAYPALQIDALLAVLEALPQLLPSLRFIAGHEDLDTSEVEASEDPTVRIRRKLDPGPMFPWDVLLRRFRKWDQLRAPAPGTPGA